VRPIQCKNFSWPPSQPRLIMGFGSVWAFQQLKAKLLECQSRLLVLLPACQGHDSNERFDANMEGEEDIESGFDDVIGRDTVSEDKNV
jgi:hypothetical protein